MMSIKRPRVAIIFDAYNVKAEPYLRSWAQRLLQREEIDARIFTQRVKEVKVVDETIFVLGGLSYPQSLRRFLQYRLQNSKEWERLQREEPPMSMGDALKLLADFAPLIEFQPDVIHLINAQSYEKYRPIIRFLQAKFVTSMRGYETAVRPLHDGKWRETLTAIFEEAAAIHFVSEYLQSTAASNGFSTDYAKVIRRAVDLEQFKPPHRPLEPSDTIRLISVGRMTWEKGYVYSLQAIRKLLDRGVKVSLRIVGDGQDQNQLAYWHHMLQLGDAVEFLGYQPHEKMVKLLVQSDIFLHSAISEGLSNAILEASAIGRPIIATTVGGIPEVVLNEQTGLLVQPADPDALAEAITLLGSNADMRQTFGQSARQYMKELFSPERETHEWLELYRSAAQQDT